MKFKKYIFIWEAVPFALFTVYDIVNCYTLEARFGSIYVGVNIDAKQMIPPLFPVALSAPQFHLGIFQYNFCKPV